MPEGRVCGAVYTNTEARIQDLLASNHQCNMHCAGQWCNVTRESTGFRIKVEQLQPWRFSNNPWLSHPSTQKDCEGLNYSHDRFCNSKGATSSEGSNENDWNRKYVRWLVLFHQSQDACDCTDCALWSTHGRPQHTDWPSRGAQPRPIMDAFIWNQTAFHKAINLSTPPSVAS